MITFPRLSLIPVVALGVTACSSLGESESSAAWSASQVRLDVQYEVVGLNVIYDTSRSVAGYPTLRATVSLTNLDDHPLTAVTGPCELLFAAYDNPDRSGERLWMDDFTSPPAPGEFMTGCPLRAWVVDVAPGGTQALGLRILPASAIVATRGPGTYFFSARLRGTLREGGSDVWLTEWLPVGSVYLAP